jgi:hypothetical protein
MAHSEMPFEHLLLLTAHQADEVIFAHRAAHRNSRLRPCGYGLRWVTDLSQAACYRSDDDFELCGRDPVGRDVCRNNLCSQLQKLASVQRLAHCMFQSNEFDGTTIVSFMHDSDPSGVVNKGLERSIVVSIGAVFLSDSKLLGRIVRPAQMPQAPPELMYCRGDGHGAPA